MARLERVDGEFQGRPYAVRLGHLSAEPAYYMARRAGGLRLTAELESALARLPRVVA